MISFTEDKPVHLVVNPHSGYGGAKLILADIRVALRQKGIPVVQHETTAPGDATDYVRRHADEMSAVMVWGGDGTVNEVANGLAGTEVPILPCPAGTENLLAKELKISRDPHRLVEILSEGQT